MYLLGSPELCFVFPEDPMDHSLPARLSEAGFRSHADRIASERQGSRGGNFPLVAGTMDPVMDTRVPALTVKASGVLSVSTALHLGAAAPGLATQTLFLGSD